MLDTGITCVANPTGTIFSMCDQASRFAARVEMNVLLESWESSTSTCHTDETLVRNLVDIYFRADGHIGRTSPPRHGRVVVSTESLQSLDNERRAKNSTRKEHRNLQVDIYSKSSTD